VEGEAPGYAVYATPILPEALFDCCCRTFSELDASLDIDSLPPPDIKGTIREPACSHVHGAKALE
jgi:hypothetical protein